MRPQSIMSRISSRFSSRHDDDRPSSRQASFPSSTTTLSVLDQVLFHASASERHFFDALDVELDKISRFYDGNDNLKITPWFLTLIIRFACVPIYRKGKRIEVEIRRIEGSDAVYSRVRAPSSEHRGIYRFLFLY